MKFELPKYIETVDKGHDEEKHPSLLLLKNLSPVESAGCEIDSVEKIQNTSISSEKYLNQTQAARSISKRATKVAPKLQNLKRKMCVIKLL